MVRCVSRGYVSILYFLSLRYAKKVLLRILRTILKVQTWLFHCVNSINFYKIVVIVSLSIMRQILKLDQPLFSKMRPFQMFLTNQYAVLSNNSCLMTEVCRLDRYSRSQNSIYSSSSKSFSKTPSSLQNSKSVANQLWFDIVALTSFNFSLSYLLYLIRSITIPWIRAQVPSSSKPIWYLFLSYAMPKMKRFLCCRYTFDTHSLQMANLCQGSLSSRFLMTDRLLVSQVMKQEVHPAKDCSRRRVARSLLKYWMASFPARHFTILTKRDICVSRFICSSESRQNSDSSSKRLSSLRRPTMQVSRKSSFFCILAGMAVLLSSWRKSWRAASRSLVLEPSIIAIFIVLLLYGVNSEKGAEGVDYQIKNFRQGWQGCDGLILASPIGGMKLVSIHTLIRWKTQSFGQKTQTSLIIFKNLTHKNSQICPIREHSHKDCQFSTHLNQVDSQQETMLDLQQSNQLLQSNQLTSFSLH